ncbi:hypothetical protein EUGRSUZ_J02347, partial [Eucalyptus grandis]
GSNRKSIAKNRIQVVVWTTYLLADYIATLTLGVLSHRLANIKETKGVIDLKSQITAFWAPFLLLHLGGPDTITAYALADNELWLRQWARLCVQIGLAFYIYSMALSGSTLSVLAAGMILVGIIKYVERSLCLYLASKRALRDSMLSRTDVSPIYPRKMEQFSLKNDEGYGVGIEEITQIPTPEDLPVNSGQDPVAKAYELFKIFKLLFVGLTIHSVDLDVSRRIFMSSDMDPLRAFRIVEIELGFMYDLLFTKAPLLNRAWGTIRWAISLSVSGAVLVFFSLQDKKDYLAVDICITFLLISVAILLEIHSLLLAISSDWIYHWRLQRPRRSAILSAIALRPYSPSPRWSNKVAQFSLLKSSIRKRKSIIRHLRSAKLEETVNKNFHIEYKRFEDDIRKLIFRRMRDTVQGLESTVQFRKMETVRNLEGTVQLSWLESLKLETRTLMQRSNCDFMIWSVDMEFDQNILIWHIATELLYHEDRDAMGSDTIGLENIRNSEMSMLISRYMLYLVVFYPSVLPTGIGVLRYEDTLVEAWKFFDDELAMLSNDEGSSISSVVIKWAPKLFKKEAPVHTRFGNCIKEHESMESRDLCDLCWLLLQVKTELPAWKMRGAKSTSVLFDACHLADQLKSADTWDIISKVWVRMLIYAACQCKGYEHCESLSRGGELLSHVWLLMAHLGIAQPVKTSGAPYVAKLI